MSASRVRFTERQALLARDLNDEQAYLLTLRRLHNLAPHRWGIAFGLDLLPEDGAVRLTPGMAVDGYGRELLVPAPLTFPADALGRVGAGDAVLVSLRYARTPTTPSPRGRYPCGPDEHTRWREETRLCLTRVPPPPPQANVPPPDARRLALAFIAAREPSSALDLSDDPERVCPVYLGLFRPGDAKTEAEPSGYTLDRSVRRYVSVVGETVRAASGQAQLAIGRQFGSGGSRFAVSLPDAQGHLADDHLTIDSPGPTTIRGQTTWVSELRPGDFPLGEPQPPPAAPPLSDLIIADYRFRAGDVLDPWCLAWKLMYSDDPAIAALRDSLRHCADNLLARLDDLLRTRPVLADLLPLVLDALNCLLTGRPGDPSGLLNRGALRGRPLRAATWRLQRAIQPSAAADDAEPVNRVMLYNRLLLEDLFPAELQPSEGLPGAWGLEFRPLAAPPTAATPWRIYRADVKQDNAALEELRIELADPGGKGDPARSVFAIGGCGPQDPAQPDGAKRFRPCLAVDAACTVTIFGNLTVEGEVVQGPVGADPNDPRLPGQLAQQYGQGASAGFNAALTLQVAVSGLTAQIGRGWDYTVTVTNTNPQAVGPVTIYDMAATDAGPVGPMTQVRYISNLAPGQGTGPVSIHHSHLLPNVVAGAKLYLVVVAVATALPSGAYGYDRADTTVAAAPSPNPP